MLYIIPSSMKGFPLHFQLIFSTSVPVFISRRFPDNSDHRSLWIVLSHCHSCCVTTGHMYHIEPLFSECCPSNSITRTWSSQSPLNFQDSFLLLHLPIAPLKLLHTESQIPQTQYHMSISLCSMPCGFPDTCNPHCSGTLARPIVCKLATHSL
jgi:hypothetical protein